MESKLCKAFKHLEKKGDVLVILCSSIQESENLFEEFERNNVEWKSGKKCTPLETKYEKHGNQTCYIVIQKSGIKFELLFGSIEGFIHISAEVSELKHHTIVTAKAFLSNPNLF